MIGNHDQTRHYRIEERDKELFLKKSLAVSCKNEISFRYSEFHDSSTVLYFLVIIWRTFLMHAFSSYTMWSVHHLLPWCILQSRKAQGLEIVLYRNALIHKHMILIKLRIVLWKLTKLFLKDNYFRRGRD